MSSTTPRGKSSDTPRTDAAVDRCRECGLSFVAREDMEKLERELAALCTGPFSDAKDCPVHRADVVQSERTQSTNGWAIRHTDGKRWRTMDTLGMPDWTSDPAKALVCRLREHVDAYAADDPEDVRIVAVDW